MGKEPFLAQLKQATNLYGMKTDFNGDEKPYIQIGIAYYNAIKATPASNRDALHAYGDIFNKLLVIAHNTIFEDFMVSLSLWEGLKHDNAPQMAIRYEEQLPTDYPEFFNAGYKPWIFGSVKPRNIDNESVQLKGISDQQIALICSLFNAIKHTPNKDKQTLQSYLQICYKLMNPSKQTQFEEIAMEMQNWVWHKIHSSPERTARQEEAITKSYNNWFELWSPTND